MDFFENFNNNFNRYLMPSIIAALGLMIIIFGMQPDETGDKQNAYFMLGGFALLVAGVLSILYVADIISRPVNLALTYGAMPVTIAIFAWFNYRSIKDDLEFSAKKEIIRTEIKQRLLDIRDAQVEFRLKYGTYAKSIATLKEFILKDSAMNITKEGMIPDVIKDEWVDSLRAWDPDKYKDRPERLSDAEGVRLGIIVRDTSYEPVLNKIFLSEKKASKRISRYPFDVDSLGIAPFTGGKEMIEFKVGKINKSGAELPAFEAKWYLRNSRLNEDKYDTLQVGSLKEPTTNGNWDE